MLRGDRTRGETASTPDRRDRSRPVFLPPAWHPWRRGPGELQLGLEPGRALVVSGLRPAEVDVVLRLAEGSSMTDAVLARWAGVSETRVGAVLDLLHAAGVLEAIGADDARPTRSLLVALQGRGSLTDRLGHTLREGRPPPRLITGAGATRLETELASRGRTGDRHPLRPDLVVSVMRDLLLSTQTATWESAGVPVLPVLATGDHVRVGPVLRHPGPCGFCLDLWHRDRDPRWTSIRDQVVTHRLVAGLDPAVDLPPPLARHAVGLCASVVHLILQGDSAAAPGTSWEVTAPWPDVVTRRWPRHPDCPGGIAEQAAQ